MFKASFLTAFFTGEVHKTILIGIFWKNLSKVKNFYIKLSVSFPLSSYFYV